MKGCVDQLCFQRFNHFLTQDKGYIEGVLGKKFTDGGDVNGSYKNLNAQQVYYINIRLLLWLSSLLHQNMVSNKKVDKTT